MRFTKKLLITTTLSLTLAVPAQSQEFRTVQVGAEAQSPVLGGVLLALLMLGIASVGSDGRGAEVTPPPDPDTPPPPPEVIDPEYAPPGGYAGVLRPRYVIGVTPLEEDPRLSGEETGSETFETPEYANSWGLGQIGASSRYAQGAFGAGSLVSVFDTGVRLDHPELSGALAPGLSYSYFADGIGDVSGHGSHVIGIIAGARDGAGVHGVAPEARIMALRAIDGPESEREGLFYLNWENAILRSVEAGADVMNNSWTFVNQDGDPVRVGSLLDRDAAIAYFGSDLIGTFAYSAQQDLVSVYAAGNGSGGDASVTAGLPLLIEELRDHWVAVVALDQNDVIADYSSQCGVAMQWCLAAPGSDIISAGVDNLYESRSGT